MGGGIFMSEHQAGAQMLGYLYQIKYALALLLDSDNENLQISIEQFDDVAFSKDGQPNQLIQLKHHVSRTGNLTDASTDLWRTLNVWVDLISAKPELLADTKFLIITTATAPLSSVAFDLKEARGRDVDSLYKRLLHTCIDTGNQKHIKYYNNFRNADETMIKKLLSNILVIDNASTILEVDKMYRKQIRYSCLSKHEDQVCERLEGWWFEKAVEGLCSKTPIFVTQAQARSFIVSVSQEYSLDNLPINVAKIIDNITVDRMTSDEKIFYEQLKLISLKNNHINIALRDYYKAFEQRSSWVRNDLLYVNELEIYEDRLIDEWEHSFANMQDELEEDDTEDIKTKKGKELFKHVDNQDIRIRPRCSASFVMRGTYHMLANQLKVGWHVDFRKRLEYLLMPMGGVK